MSVFHLWFEPQQGRSRFGCVGCDEEERRVVSGKWNAEVVTAAQMHEVKNETCTSSVQILTFYPVHSVQYWVYTVNFTVRYEVDGQYKLVATTMQFDSMLTLTRFKWFKYTEHVRWQTLYYGEKLIPSFLVHRCVISSFFPLGTFWAFRYVAIFDRLQMNAWFDSPSTHGRQFQGWF